MPLMGSFVCPLVWPRSQIHCQSLLKLYKKLAPLSPPDPTKMLHLPFMRPPTYRPWITSRPWRYCQHNAAQRTFHSSVRWKPSLVQQSTWVVTMVHCVCASQKPKSALTMTYYIWNRRGLYPSDPEQHYILKAPDTENFDVETMQLYVRRPAQISPLGGMFWDGPKTAIWYMVCYRP